MYNTFYSLSILITLGNFILTECFESGDKWPDDNIG